MAAPTVGAPSEAPLSCASSVTLPRITLTYCTQCKWLLRAAYYAQELLSTFGTDLGEVALRPSVGGVFTVDVESTQSPERERDGGGGGGGGGGEGDGGDGSTRSGKVRIWDRKVDGGFPETKILKRKVRDIIAPERELGHVDRDYSRDGAGGAQMQKPEQTSTVEKRSEEGNGGAGVGGGGGGGVQQNHQQGMEHGSTEVEERNGKDETVCGDCA